MDNIEETTKRVLALNTEFLKSGIDLDQPLDVIMEQAKKAGIGSKAPKAGTTKAGTKTVIRFDKDGNLIE